MKVGVNKTAPAAVAGGAEGSEPEYKEPRPGTDRERYGVIVQTNWRRPLWVSVTSALFCT